MRKDSYSADARPMFFEKELFYSKLTVASDIEKGLLLVSFGAVESLCFGVLKKAFLYRIALHELKKLFFSANQKFSIYRKLYALPSKASRFRKQNTACLNHFLLSSKTAFFTYKNLSFAQAFPCRFQKPPIFTNQKPCFCTNLSLLLSKAILFCPPLPISTPLNLLFAKNTAVLLLFALNPYAVKPERRTDSNHCRRYPAKLQLFAKPVT